MVVEVNMRKAFLLCDHGSLSKDNTDQQIYEVEPPPDKYFLAILFCFFTGIAGMLPMSFFLTANDYWMYKFRDISSETYDLNNKTFLQKMFGSIDSIGTAVPSLISVLLSARYSNMFGLRKRYLFCLGTCTSMFIVFTCLVKVNTDSWQTLFFVLVIAVIGTISLVQPLLGMTNMSLISNFPAKFLRINLYGSTVGGLFGSILQIISLSIGNNSTKVALIYFSCGTVVITITFLLSILMKHSPVIDFYTNVTQAPKRPQVPLREYINVAKLVWPLMLMTLIFCMGNGFGHSNVTALVVPEEYKANQDNLWYHKYFVATITFLSYDVFQLIGRYFVKSVITKKNVWIFITISAARSFVLMPLFMFCNARPREHLPVLFPHDYQYMIMHAVSSLAMSYLGGVQFLSIPNFAGPKSEVAFMLMSALGSVISTGLSPLNPVIVAML